MKAGYLGAAIAAVICFSPPAAVAAPQGPSFDCGQAQSTDERAVCASPELAELDLLAAEAYAAFQPEFGDKRAIARALMADRRACGDDQACIAAVYSNALQTYGAGPAWPALYAEALVLRKAEDLGQSAAEQGPVPSALAQCSATRIASLTDRFGTPLDQADESTGSAVEFANGGRQVSYAREIELVQSEVGDEVVMCLMEVPRDCPPGDDRGRSYLTVNLSKGFVWVLGDSQHKCGGA